MEYFALNRTVAPASEPVTLTEVKEWIRADTGDISQDNTLTSLISAARMRCERVSRQALITQTWQMVIDRFPGLVFVSPDYPGWEYLRLGADGDPRVIRLPRPPLISVSSITYIDTTGTQQTVSSANYQVDNVSMMGRIFPAYGQYWPVTRPQGGAVTITYVAGYGTSGSNVPDDMKIAMKNCIGYQYENREQSDENYLDSLFAAFQYGGYLG